MSLSIQTFGNTQIHKPIAYQLAIDIQSSLSRYTALDILHANGIGVLSRSDVSNISALEETEFEERAQFDVLFCVAQNVPDDLGEIQTFNIAPGTVV